MTLSRKRFGCVCIVDGEGRLAGIITDGDLARNLDKNLGALMVDDIMTRTPKTIDPDTLAGEAIAILDEKRISALVVVGERQAGRHRPLPRPAQDRRGLGTSPVLPAKGEKMTAVIPPRPPVPDRGPPPP